MRMAEVVSNVSSREDFIRFLAMLNHDLLEHEAEWENSSLADFLVALSAWTQDMDGYYKNRGLEVPESPSWKNLSEMFLAAKYYE